MTSAQLQEPRAASLCYKCDEKFYPSHKCTIKRFLLLLGDDPPLNPNANTLIENSFIIEVSVHFHLFPQAFFGNPLPHIFISSMVT